MSHIIHQTSCYFGIISYLIRSSYCTVSYHHIILYHIANLYPFYSYSVIYFLFLRLLTHSFHVCLCVYVCACVSSGVALLFPIIKCGCETLLCPVSSTTSHCIVCRSNQIYSLTITFLNHYLIFALITFIV